jgi:CelD/BcsL family acetyltransferase involved in cellulose biosynthesis
VTLLLDPVADQRWQDLVDRSPGASVFHHPAWLGLLARHYGYTFAAPCAIDPDGRAEAGLPVALVASRLTGRRLVAVPFSDRCGPLVAAGAGAGARERLATAVEELRAVRGLPLTVHEAFGELPGATVRDRYHEHAIDLSEGAETAEKRFASRVRRNTRRAVRLGLTFHRGVDRPALDAFYDLHVQTRRRLGVPTQPRGFIRELEGLFRRELGFVGIVRRDGEPIAAAVFLGAGRTLTYKYGASDARHLDARPNNLLFTETVRWAAGAGYASLDLGRTDIGQEGLREFKLSGGASDRMLAYTTVGGAGGAGGERGEKLLGALIRRSPPWVGRAIGTLLYRHVG